MLIGSAARENQDQAVSANGSIKEAENVSISPFKRFFDTLWCLLIYFSLYLSMLRPLAIYLEIYNLVGYTGHFNMNKINQFIIGNLIRHIVVTWYVLRKKHTYIPYVHVVCGVFVVVAIMGSFEAEACRVLFEEDAWVCGKLFYILLMIVDLFLTTLGHYFALKALPSTVEGAANITILEKQKSGREFLIFGTFMLMVLFIVFDLLTLLGIFDD